MYLIQSKNGNMMNVMKNIKYNRTDTELIIDK